MAPPHAGRMGEHTLRTSQWWLCTILILLATAPTTISPSHALPPSHPPVSSPFSSSLRVRPLVGSAGSILTYSSSRSRQAAILPRDQHQHTCIELDDNGEPASIYVHAGEGALAAGDGVRCTEMAHTNRLDGATEQDEQQQPPKAAIDTRQLKLRWEEEKDSGLSSPGSKYFIRWSTPPLESTPSTQTSDDSNQYQYAQPSNFLYSLFAEWDQPTAFVDSSGSTRLRIERHNLRLCEVNTRHRSHRLECDVTDMPTGIDIVYTLLVECHQCRAALSSALTVRAEHQREDSLSEENTDQMNPHVMHSKQSPLVIDRVANDTDVRIDLAQFYTDTNGPKWQSNSGWLNDSISLCDWAGIYCDSTRSRIIGFNFSSSDHGSIVPFSLRSVSADMSNLVRHITTLEFLWLAGNMDLCIGPNGIDLTQQQALNKISMAQAMGDCTPAVFFDDLGYYPIYLPSLSHLHELHLDSSICLVHNVTLISFPSLTLLSLNNFPGFPVAGLKSMPLLTELTGGCSLQARTPDSQGRSGGELTQEWLGNIDYYHPALRVLDLSVTTSSSTSQLDFGSGRNFPFIRSKTLEYLAIDGLSQLTSDPPQQWLAYLPSLSYLSTTNLPNSDISLSTFEFAASKQFSELHLSTIDQPTTISGSIEPLLPFGAMTTLYMSGMSLNGSLPSNLSAYWPHLATLVIQNSGLDGQMPAFNYLPNLTILYLTGAGFDYYIPDDFLMGSTDKLLHLHLERK